MSILKSISAVLTAFAALAVIAGPVRAAEVQTVVSLEDAVRQGLVKVDVNACGGAYGDAIEVAVQRLVDREVRVKVEPGTVFVSVGGDVQNMAGRRIKGEMINQDSYRPTDVMVLADGTRRTYLVEAYCMDYEKPAPKANDGFKLAARDPRAARVLVRTPLANVDVSIEAIQSALWMDRAGVSGDELRQKHGFTNVDVRVGADIVKRVREIALGQIPAGMPADVRVEVERLFSSDPEARRRAAVRVSAMGPRAAVALPFLRENSTTVRPLQPEANAGGARPAVSVVVDPERGVQVDVDAAADALAAMLKNRPVEPLFAMLKNSGPLMRRHAARTLGVIGNPRAVPRLIVALGDSDRRVKELAEQSLKQITKQDFGRDRAKWVEWWDKNKASLLPPQEPPKVSIPEEAPKASVPEPPKAEAVPEPPRRGPGPRASQSEAVTPQSPEVAIRLPRRPDRRSYSWRSASMGSIDAARMAG